MRLGFVSRVTTWLRRRPMAIFVDMEKVEELGNVVWAFAVEVDRLLLDMVIDGGGGLWFSMRMKSDSILIITMED